MKSHNYVRPGKFKNVNCPYALVRGIVFPSIYSAESYCTAHGLDVNTEIESDDPRVLAKCRQIAEFTLPMLRGIQEHYQEYFNSKIKDADKKVELRNTSRDNGTLGWEVLQDWVIAATGEISGVGSCINMLYSCMDTLEKILLLEGGDL